MNERKILGGAISSYGSEIQRVIAIEELSELQKELCKSLRGQTDRQHIAEEIADVQIMLEQMMLLHDCRDDVDEWRRRMLEQMMILYELHNDVASWRWKKVDRLHERLIRDGWIEGNDNV